MNNTEINRIKTYFGAFEVIEKILPGSKNLNIQYLYLNSQNYKFNVKNYPIKNVEGDNNEG